MEIRAGTLRAVELRETHRKRPKRWICAKIFCIRSRTPWKRDDQAAVAAGVDVDAEEQQHPRELGAERVEKKSKKPSVNAGRVGFGRRRAEGVGQYGWGTKLFTDTRAQTTKTKRKWNDAGTKDEANLNTPRPAPAESPIERDKCCESAA